jgi:transcriptional regulator with XRE-family HTH domain
VDDLAQRLSTLVDARFGGNWADMSRAAGLRPSTVQKIKDGADPRASTLLRIAQALGVSVDGLLSGKGGEPECTLGESPVVYAPRAHPPSTPLDHPRLSAAIETVLSGLETTGRRLPAPQMAELIAAVYDLFEDSAPETSRGVVLRLIKSAS